MREISLRKFHRFLGVLIAPLVFLQAASGLVLALDLLGRWQGKVRLFLEDVHLPALAQFWDAVFYQIHFGSGSVGLVHTVAVGVSLLLLVVTGVVIFVKILARSGVRALGWARASPATAQPGPVYEKDGVVSGRRMVAVLGMTALGLMALDVYIFSAAYRLIGLHTPHFYAVAQIRNHVTRSRVALERVLAGDPRASVDRMRNEVASATELALVLLGEQERRAAGDRDGVGGKRAILPVENVDLRRRVAGITHGLRLLEQRVGAEALDGAADGKGLVDGEVYRRALEGLEASAGGVAETVMDVVEQDRERFFAIHLVLFSAAFLFLVALGAVLYLYEAGRTRQLRAVHTARDIARAYEQRFREVIRQAADPLLVFDDDGRILAVSLTAARLLGYEEDGLLTLNFADVDSRSTAERDGLWREITPGAPAAAKSSWRHRSGRDIPVVLSLAVIDACDAETGTSGWLFLAQARLGDATER